MRAASAVAARPEGRDGRRAPARRACRPPSPPPATATRSPCTSSEPTPAARCASPRPCPTGPSSAISCATSSPSASAWAWTIEYGVAVWPVVVDERRPDAVVVATGAEPARPWWAPPEATHVLDVRDVLDGATCSTRATAVPRATSWSSTRSASTTPRRSPSCWPTAAARSRSSRTAWSSGRTSASRSTWRAGGCGRRPRASSSRPTSCPMGLDGPTLQLLHHPTGRMQERTPDWVVLAVPAQPVEWLYHDLKAAGVARRPGRRLRGAAAGPRRGDRGRAGGSGVCDRRVVAGPGRVCCLPAGSRPSAECGGRALLVGDGAASRRRSSPGVATTVSGVGRRGFRAGGVGRRARGLADRGGRAVSCCRHRRTAATSRPAWPTRSTGRCSPAPSR